MAMQNTKHLKHILNKYNITNNEENIKEYIGMDIPGNRPKLFRSQRNNPKKGTLHSLVVWQLNFGLDPNSKYFCYIPNLSDEKYEIKFEKRHYIRLHTFNGPIKLSENLKTGRFGTKDNWLYTGLVITDDKNKVLLAKLTKLFVWHPSTTSCKNSYKDKEYEGKVSDKKVRYHKEDEEEEYNLVDEEKRGEKTKVKTEIKYITIDSDEEEGEDMSDSEEEDEDEYEEDEYEKDESPDESEIKQIIKPEITGTKRKLSTLIEESNKAILLNNEEKEEGEIIDEIISVAKEQRITTTAEENKYPEAKKEEVITIIIDDGIDEYPMFV